MCNCYKRNKMVKNQKTMVLFMKFLNVLSVGDYWCRDYDADSTQK